MAVSLVKREKLRSKTKHSFSREKKATFLNCHVQSSTGTIKVIEFPVVHSNAEVQEVLGNPALQNRGMMKQNSINYSKNLEVRFEE